MAYRHGKLYALTNGRDLLVAFDLGYEDTSEVKISRVNTVINGVIVATSALRDVLPRQLTQLRASHGQHDSEGRQENFPRVDDSTPVVGVRVVASNPLPPPRPTPLSRLCEFMGSITSM